MLALLLDTAWLLLPLLGGGVLHGLAMRGNWLPWLARPIDGGRAWCGTRCFGDNKTWRGPVCVGLGAGLALGAQALAGPGMMARVYPQQHHPAAVWAGLGLLLGALAMLGELPNSFLKRRAGIAPGAGGRGRFAAFFYLYDQVDLLLPLAPAWWLLGALTGPRLLLALVLVVVLHQALSSIGYRLGMRKTPR